MTTRKASVAALEKKTKKRPSKAKNTKETDAAEPKQEANMAAPVSDQKDEISEKKVSESENIMDERSTEEDTKVDEPVKDASESDTSTVVDSEQEDVCSEENDEDSDLSTQQDPEEQEQKSCTKQNKQDISAESEDSSDVQKPQEDTNVPKEVDDGLSVFIKGFANEITEAALRNELSKHGNVKNIRIPKDRRTGKNKGFAYVDFDAEKTVSQGAKAQENHGDRCLG